MKKTFLILYGLCTFILTVLIPFINKDNVHTVPNDVLRGAVLILISHKVATVVICGLYIFIYTLIPKWILPSREKRRLKEKIMQRMIPELLGGDLEQHRITLFRETNYIVAFLRHYCAFFTYLFSKEKWKCKLFLNFPKRGRYLIIDIRFGLQYQKSLTMFRVEHNEQKFCDGIASYIRYRRTSVSVPDLPDVSDVDLRNVNTITDIRKGRRKDMARYMQEGFIRDLNTLKTINRRARHFYGTIITKRDSTPWGVLLIDSVSPDDPFNPEVKKRFDSFAVTLSAIQNMEV